jgi:hypothetical protein
MTDTRPAYPPHVVPLLRAIGEQPETERDALLVQFHAFLAAISPRLLTWCKQHPIKDPNVIKSSDIPPITLHEGRFVWVTRRVRRKR